MYMTLRLLAWFARYNIFIKFRIFKYMLVWIFITFAFIGIKLTIIFRKIHRKMERQRREDLK